MVALSLVGGFSPAGGRLSGSLTSTSSRPSRPEPSGSIKINLLIITLNAQSLHLLRAISTLSCIVGASGVAAKGKVALPEFDMAVIVPKDDELGVVEQLFGADFSVPELELEGVERPVYSLMIGDLRTAVVGIGGQGNAIARSVTDHVISQLNAPLLFLLGTALGNRSRCSLGSVVVSEMVHDLSERRRLDDKTIYRANMFEPYGRLRREVGRYQNSYDRSRLQRSLRNYADAAAIHLPEDVENGIAVEFQHVSAGNDLIESATVQQEIWDRDDRIACYDMESGGFAASANQHSGVLWLVIRGVSDFGDTSTKRVKGMRSLSTAAAVAFLRDFVDEGLKSCHPRTIRTPVSKESQLSPNQFYTRYDGYGWFRSKVQERLGIKLPSTPLGRDLTLAGFATICEHGSFERGWLIERLFKLREEYFEEKYSDYAYGDDIRGFIPGWSEEVHDIYRRLTIRLSATDVLDVGCGNGLELTPLFEGARSVTGVDVSQRLLRKAAAQFDGLRTVHTSAEELKGVETDSIDLYVSLRVYMSRFFDMQASISEAYRVLRPGGTIIISIANGYLNITESGKREVVRGLKTPGTHGMVDPHEPYRVQKRVRELLTAMGFENIQIAALATDIYLWGQTPMV